MRKPFSIPVFITFAFVIGVLSGFFISVNLQLIYGFLCIVFCFFFFYYFIFINKYFKYNTILIFLFFFFLLFFISLYLYLIYGFLLFVFCLFIFYYFKAKKKYFQDKTFGILAFLMLFLLGFINTKWHQPQQNLQHYIHQDLKEKVNLEIVIKEVLKPNDFQENYIAEIQTLNQQKTQGKILLSIQ